VADLADLFKTIELPVMPALGLELVSTLDKQRTTVAEVGALISRDPALAAKLLALANSAAFGLPRKVANLDSALQLIGMSRVRALALSACLHNAFSLPEGLHAEDFWSYNVACAGYAQWLAEGVDSDAVADRQKVWLAALMLRLGEVIIGHALPDALPYIELTPCAPGQRWDRERQLSGFDEGEVMAELARRWNFPADLVEALLWASDPLAGKPMHPIAGILHLASHLADQPSANADAIDTLPVPVMSALDLKYGWLKSTFPERATFANAPFAND